MKKGRARGRGSFLFAMGTKVQKEQELTPMSRLSQRFQSVADNFAIASVLVSLPAVVGAVILASF